MGKAKPETTKPPLGVAVPTPGLVAPAPGVAPPTPEMATTVPGMAKQMPEKTRGLMKLWKEGPQVMELLQRVVEDVKVLKEDHARAQELPEFNPMKFLQRVEEVEKTVKNWEERLEPLCRKMTVMTPGEELTMVTWEELEQAITDGWKASQGIESTPATLKHKGKPPAAPRDVGPSAPSTVYPGADRALDSAGGLGPDQTLPGPGGSRHPSEGEQKLPSAPGFPDRGRDEAGLAKPHPLPGPQFRTEADQHRPGEWPSTAGPRRDERDAHPGPVPQDLPLDQHPLMHPDARGGMTPSPGQVMDARPDQLGPGPPGLDQLEVQPPSAYPYGLPFRPGLMPPGTEEQGPVPPGMGQQNVMPPWVPARDQQGWGLPGPAQPGMVPPGAQQYGVRFRGPDQRAMERPAMDGSGVGPIGTDEHGLPIFGMDQQGLVPPLRDQQGFVQPGLETPGFIQPGALQYGVLPPGAGQPGLVSPGMDQRGFVPPGAGQPGFVPPGAGQPGFVPPGAGQPGFVPPGAGQPGFVPPGAGQPGFVPPGAGQPGFVPPGAGQPGFVPPGAGQPGFIPPGAGQPGFVPPGAGQPGFIPPGAGQPGFVPPGAGQPGFVPPGAGQPGFIPPGVDQHGLVQAGQYPPGFVQPGAYPYSLAQPGVYPHGFVQPGVAGQPGLVPPGAGQPGLVPPGIGQPGLVPPGAGQPGLVPPGVGQPGLVPPGAGQPGLLQPGTSQPDLVQPGMDQRGSVQPGAGQPGLVQPGMDQRGSVQPGAGQPGLVQPGVDQHDLAQPGAYPPGSMQPDIDQQGLVEPVTDQLGADHQGLVPSGAEPHGSPRPDQHGLAPPGRDQHGQVSPRLSRQGWVSPSMDQEGLVPTDPSQRGIDQGGAMPFTYPGPYSPRYSGVDPGQRSGYTQPPPSPNVPSAQSTDSLGKSRQVSQEPSSMESKKLDSLEKVASSFPSAVETFRLMGELIGLYTELKESLRTLDAQKAGETDLEKIQYLLAMMVQKTIPPDLQEQLKALKTLTKEVRQEKAKLDKIQRLLEGGGLPEVGKEVAAGPLSFQLGLLRVSVNDIEKELSDLRESQEQGKVNMEHSVSEASLYLQNQLDKLRTIIENMLASSSTLLTMSMAPRKPPVTLIPGQIDPKATCPACSLDLSHQVSTLVQRYEQLQHMVTSLAASRPSKKAKLQRQDEELLGHVQSAILQVQGDCEKLNLITGNLIEDHRQKQRDIDVLYQGLEKLEKEKVNRGHLEMEIEVKADKSALEAKVSRMQFDATTEQLNHMMQELVAKMSGQERDWQKMLDRLLTEMDSKLDRLELDPVKQLLEDRWKSLRQQLKERSPLYQADEAAGMRRQLLAHFHCLSCDRPLETAVTGQVLPTTPVGPSLPGHRSTRPYTVFELEQVRQQSRNLKLGNLAFPRADLASMERSVGRLRTMHSKMLMDIEKVQFHYGGSVKASSQMIHELLQAQCLGSPCCKRVSEMTDYSFATVSRHCGGSHTLTYPYRRTRLQHLPQGLLPEDSQVAGKHHEVDILGLDGHIYKGRMDMRLPGIPNKDSAGNNKHKMKPSRSHAHRSPALGDSSPLPLRPQSANMMVGGTSGSCPLGGALPPGPHLRMAGRCPVSPGEAGPGAEGGAWRRRENAWPLSAGWTRLRGRGYERPHFRGNGQGRSPRLWLQAPVRPCPRVLTGCVAALAPRA
ncbi:glutamine-rich protein 2 isoform X1 [Myotis myotis]|uniref:glutamine-rich protein 2 isoform X1 n=1 Tax=Myotis myotis TaxID=51298 RepID=UPI00174AB1BF|nr:glutamine-rich protein 2 isoform X1 [Myotis myotis]